MKIFPNSVIYYTFIQKSSKLHQKKRRKNIYFGYFLCKFSCENQFVVTYSKCQYILNCMYTLVKLRLLNKIHHFYIFRLHRMECYIANPLTNTNLNKIYTIYAICNVSTIAEKHIFIANRPGLFKLMDLSSKKK